MKKICKQAVVKKVIRLILITILLSFVGESICSGYIYLRGKENSGKQVLSGDRIEQADMLFTDGKYQYQTGIDGIVTLTFDEQYINKFQYYYDADGDFLCTISLYGQDVYGNESITQICDLNAGSLKRSVVTVQDTIHKIELLFHADQATAIAQIRQGVPSTAQNLEVSEFMLDNSFRFNPFRAIVIMAVTGIVLLLFVFRKEIGANIEIGVFIISLITATAWLLVFPPLLMGWDEHIHLLNTVSLFSESGSVSAAISYLHGNPEYMGQFILQSVEEKLDMIRYLNSIAVTDVPIGSYSRSLSFAGYFLSAVTAWIGKGLQLPFYLYFILAKWVNVVMYSIMAYFAVKYARVGKALFAAIALYPVIIFSTLIYSYDITVLAFLLLGTSVIISELATPNDRFPLKMQIIFLLSVVVGCLPKATYAPILLLGLLLPKTKFNTKKAMYLFKGVICLLFCGLIFTFVLPTLLAPPAVGDSRGGDTSTASQVSLIFSQPFSYLYVWWQNVKATFSSYMLGLPQMSVVAYFGNISNSFVVGVFLILVMITDTNYRYKNEVVYLQGKYRVVIAFCITMILGMIWSALYLSFTEVGKLTIAGVQPRYYFPLMGMFLLLFQTNKVRIEWDKKKYNLLILSVSFIFLIVIMWKTCKVFIL